MARMTFMFMRVAGDTTTDCIFLHMPYMHAWQEPNGRWSFGSSLRANAKGCCLHTVLRGFAHGSESLLRFVAMAVILSPDQFQALINHFGGAVAAQQQQQPDKGFRGEFIITSMLSTMVQDFDVVYQHVDEGSAAKDVWVRIQSSVGNKAAMSECPVPMYVGEVADEWGCDEWTDEGWPDDLVQGARADTRCHRCEGWGPVGPSCARLRRRVR